MTSIVIISHASDVQFAISLATSLKNMGFSVWVDRLSLSESDDWEQRIFEAAATASAVILIFSPMFFKSYYYRTLAERIYQESTPILPILAYPLSAENFPFRADFRLMIDAVGWTSPQVYEACIQQVYQWVSSQSISFETVFSVERKYLNLLSAKVALYKASLQPLSWLFDTPTGAYIERNWGMNGEFLARGVLLNEHVPVGNLTRWTETTKRFVLVGENGVGKTTALMRLFDESIKRYRHAQEQRLRGFPLPFWVSLEEWESHETLDGFFRRVWFFNNDVLHEIEAGRVILYLDGLDSMGGDTTRKINALREWLHGENAPIEAIFTCDLTRYLDDCFLNLPVLSLEVRDDSWVNTQAHFFLTHVLAEEFLTVIATYPLWRIYARYPLWLSRLLFVFHQAQTSDFPQNPPQLLKMFLERLWERQQILNHTDWVDWKTLSDKLSPIGLGCVRDGDSLALNLATLSQQLGDGLLDVLQQAFIFRAENGVIRFNHRSDVLFWGANAVFAQPIYDQLVHPRLADTGNYLPTFWEECLAYWVALHDSPSLALNQVSEVNPLLALCALEWVQVDIFTWQNLLESGVTFVRERHLMPALERLVGRLITVHSSETGQFLRGVLSSVKSGETMPISFFQSHSSTSSAQKAVDRLQHEKHASSTDTINSSVPEIEENSDLLSAQSGDLSPASSEFEHPLLFDEDNALITLESIILRLRDATWEIRELGAKQLHSFCRDLEGKRHADVVLRLETLLADEDDFMRWAVVVGLTWIGDNRVISALTRMTRDPVWTVRLAVVRAFGTFNDASATRALIELLADNHRLVREASAQVLGYLRRKEAVPILRSLLKDKTNPSVQRVVATALGAIGDRRAVTPLIEVLDDADKQLCWVAVEALGKLSDLRAIDPLLALVDDSFCPTWQQPPIRTLGELARDTIELIKMNA